MTLRVRRSPAAWKSLLEDALAAGKSVSDVVVHTRASIVTVRTHATRNGIALRRANSAKRKVDWAAEFQTAVTRGETASDLARRLEVSISSVDKAKAKFGVVLLPSPGGAAVCADWQAEFRRALDQGEHQAALARRLGLKAKTVSQAARRLNIRLPRKASVKH